MTTTMQSRPQPLYRHGVIRRVAGCLAVALAMFATAFVAQPAQAEPEPITELIGGFESDDDGWSLGLGPEYPGAEGTYSRDDADAVEGDHSALLSGDFSGGGNYIQISRSLGLDVEELQFWARSNDLSQVGLRMVDSTGQTHQQRIPLEPGGDWQELVVTEFDAGVAYSSFGGANDGVWHPPASGISLMLPRTALLPERSDGEVRFDEVTVTALAELPDLAIEQVAIGNVFVQPETVALDVQTRGDTLSWSVRDFWGAEVASGVEPGGDVTLAGLAEELGYYELELTAELDGSVIATETTDFALLSPFDVSEVEDSPFGTSPHFKREDNFDKMPLAAKMGVKNIRESLEWPGVEPEPGEYVFGHADPLVAELEDNGIKWLPMAAYSNQHYDGGATPYTDEGREGYANYAAAIVDHYSDQVEWIEIFNEFNIKVFGARGGSPANSQADYYYPLLKAAYETIKETDPDVTVVGGATSSVPLDWLEELFALGGLEYMDVVSVHPYVYPAEPEEAAELIEDLADLIREYNDGELIPIWITEQGYPTHTHAQGVSETTQARNLVRSYVTMFSEGVEKFFFYNFMNKGTNPGNNEHEFGLIRNVNDQRGPYVPKPGYVGYAAMARQLTGASYDRAEDVGGGVESHVFTTGGHDLRVLWSTEPATVAIKSDLPVTVTDVMGVSERYQPHAGRIYLDVTENPIYLAGSDVKIAVDDRFALTADRDGTVVAGDPVELTLAVDNTTPPRAPIVGTFEIGGESVPVSVRPGQQAEIPITLPASDTTGDVTFVGELVLHDRPSARLAVDVTVAEPVEIAAQHVLLDGGDAVSVTVTSLAHRDLAVGDLEWTVGDQNGTAELPSPLPAESAHTVTIPLTGLPDGNHDREVRFAVDGYPDVVSTGTVSMVDPESLVGVADRTITVDGVLDGLSGVPGVDLAADGSLGGRWTSASDEAWIHGGEDDLGGEIWPTWDEDNLYLSARIQDNVHHQRYPGVTLWSGDSIQFAVAAGTPGEEAPLRYYEYRVALTPDGPTLYRATTAGELPVGVVSDAVLAIVRDETTAETVYELALPWGLFAPVEADDGLLSLSLQVQDNDGLDRKGWISWSTKPVRLDPAP